MSAHFEGNYPILRVEDMERSLHFYRDLLDFKVVDWSNDNFASIYNGGAHFFLCRQGQGRGGAWLWIGVHDAQALHQECVAKGIKVRMPPRNFFFAMEFHIEDPDGNVLRLGSDPKSDRPFDPDIFDQD